MKLLRKCVGKPVEVVETSEKYFMDCVKQFFGKEVFTGRVYLEGMEFIMVVDEDAPLKRLPLNFYMAFNDGGVSVQQIWGDVLFVRNKYADIWGKEIWDFEILDVTERDVEGVEALCGPVMQNSLKAIFKGGSDDA